MSSFVRVLVYVKFSQHELGLPCTIGEPAKRGSLLRSSSCQALYRLVHRAVRNQFHYPVLFHCFARTVFGGASLNVASKDRPQSQPFSYSTFQDDLGYRLKWVWPKFKNEQNESSGGSHCERTCT